MYGVFLDTETSGLNPHKHSLLEVAFKVLEIASGKEVVTYSSILAQPQHLWEKADPMSLIINGFTWEEVSQGKPVKAVAGEAITALAQVDIRGEKGVFICQNPSFDRAFFSQLIDPDLQEALGWPYHWLDLASMFWARNINTIPQPWESGLSKDKISEFYRLLPEEKPHRAMNGVNHLIECYEAVVGFPAKITI
jgi:DNA polymerase III alpha subunit (gram-positive type)